MRIVAGRWGGRRIESPDDPRARPTTERVREAWMSIMQDRLGDARCLDLFAGTGAMGLEALSRGAASCDFVELHQPNLAALARNIELLGAEHATLVRADALRFAARLAPLAYDVAFADPPYTTDDALKLVALFRATPFAGVLSVEHSADAPVSGDDTRRYGDTAVTFLYAPASTAFDRPRPPQ